MDARVSVADTAAVAAMVIPILKCRPIHRPRKCVPPRIPLRVRVLRIGISSNRPQDRTRPAERAQLDQRNAACPADWARDLVTVTRRTRSPGSQRMIID